MRQQQREQQEVKGKEYSNLINSLRSESTIRMYRFSIDHYMRFIKTNNISSLLKPDNKAIEDQIVSYLVEMRKSQKLSYASLSQRLAC